MPVQRFADPRTEAYLHRGFGPSCTPCELLRAAGYVLHLHKLPQQLQLGDNHANAELQLLRLRGVRLQGKSEDVLAQLLHDCPIHKNQRAQSTHTAVTVDS